MKQFGILKRTNLICAYSGGLIVQHINKVFWVDSSLKKKNYLFSLPENFLYKLFAHCRLLERLLRLEIRNGIVERGMLFFSVRGNQYCFDMKKGILEKQKKHRTGMKSPLMYAHIPAMPGFDEQICYGDYFSNRNRESISIWSSKDLKDWEEVYVFKEQMIRHIHGIVPDQNNNCVYIMTGDSDLESAIWIAKENFRFVERLAGGGQKYRTCQMQVWNNKIRYITDSEYEKNKVYLLEGKKEDSCLYEIGEIKGSVIYGDYDEESFVFSTTVEPDKGGIGSNCCIVYELNSKNEIKELFSGEKDIFPMKFFQYGFCKIILLEKSIFISVCGLKKYDGVLMKLR